MIQKIRSKFLEIYHSEPEIFRSPGRVNILGEHTDYNEGFVLPAAIDKNVFIAIRKRADTTVNLHAVDFDENFTADINNIQQASMQWPNYILGVIDQLQKNGHTLSGFDLVIDGDVPVGAGLSSSAAVECAAIFAFNEIFGLGLDRLAMVPLAQKAEHVFAGVNCGIMDQFASMFGKKDHVIRLDCRSLEYEYVPFKMDGYKIVLLNTNVKHNLASSEYNTRRKQCEQGVSMINKFHPEIKSLRDADLNMLEKYVKPHDDVVYRRCKYVVEENERLLAGCKDLQGGDILSLGSKMYGTHSGLSVLYEVSCRELDFLVDYVKDIPAVAGARMMGGGFGGCTINLVQDDAVESLISSVSKAYSEAMDLPLTAYVASIEDGTSSCVEHLK